MLNGGQTVRHGRIPGPSCFKNGMLPIAVTKARDVHGRDRPGSGGTVHTASSGKRGCKRWRASVSCGLELTDPDRMWWKSSGRTPRLLTPVDARSQLRALDAKRGTQIAERRPSEPGNQKRRLRGTPPITAEWGHANDCSFYCPSLAVRPSNLKWTRFGSAELELASRPLQPSASRLPRHCLLNGLDDIGQGP